MIHNRKTTLFLITTFLMLAFLAACSPTSSGFMDALKAGEDTTAFNLLDEDLQEELGGRDGFGEWANEWRPASFSFGGSCSTNLTRQRAYGSGTLANGDRFFMDIYLYKDNDVWIIAGIQVSGAIQDQLWGVTYSLSCDD